MKLISIITPTYNEEMNVLGITKQVSDVMNNLKGYDYEHIFIDNDSQDRTVDILKVLAGTDKHIKIIENTRNFGHLRSPYYALLQCNGDAGCIVAADGQDPPEVVMEFIKYWELGYKVVVGVKNQSKENKIKILCRDIYYKALNKVADKPLIANFMGFGLYDRCVIDKLKEIDDPYPYLRGLIVELGYKPATVSYSKPERKNGNSHNNLYTLFDTVMLGFINNSKVPLRLATLCGIIISLFSFIVGVVYLVLKLIHWNNFEVGLAPVIIGVSFLGGVQLLFLGIIGEYIGNIYTQVLHRPLVIEKQRTNF